MWRATTRDLLFTIHLYRIVIAKDIRGPVLWQGLPYIKHNSGQITLTQSNQRTLSREARTGGSHMSRGKIKKALPSDFEESLSK